MKKKIILGLFLFAVIGINVTLNFSNFQNVTSISELINNATASAEGSGGGESCAPTTTYGGTLNKCPNSQYSYGVVNNTYDCSSSYGNGQCYSGYTYMTYECDGTATGVDHGTLVNCL